MRPPISLMVRKGGSQQVTLTADLISAIIQPSAHAADLKHDITQPEIPDANPVGNGVQLMILTVSQMGILLQQPMNKVDQMQEMINSQVAHNIPLSRRRSIIVKRHSRPEVEC